MDTNGDQQGEWKRKEEEEGENEGQQEQQQRSSFFGWQSQSETVKREFGNFWQGFREEQEGWVGAYGIDSATTCV